MALTPEPEVNHSINGSDPTESQCAVSLSTDASPINLSIWNFFDVVIADPKRNRTAFICKLCKATAKNTRMLRILSHCVGFHGMKFSQFCANDLMLCGFSESQIAVMKRDST